MNAGFRGSDAQGLLQQGFKPRRVGRLGNKVDGAQRARMAGIGLIVLAGEHDDLHLRRGRDQFGDQLETFVGAVRPRRQAEVDQRKLRRPVHLSQQRLGMGTRFRRAHIEVAAQHIGQRVGDRRIVVDDQQFGFCRVGHGANRILADASSGACRVADWVNTK